MMNKTKYHFFLFYLVLTVSCALICTHSYANTKAHYPIGQVAALQGKAWAGDGDGKAALKEGDPVFFHSSISTGPDARLLILFIDDTEITLGEDARLTIDEYIFDPYDSSENVGAFDIKGAFLWTSGMISKRDEPRVDIKTPKGSIGIRGTQFWGGELEEGYGVFVSDGLVEFSGDWGNAEIPRDKGFILKNKVADDFEEEANNAHDEVTEWGEDMMERALSSVAFDIKGQAAFKKKMREMRQDNIRKRHDYRGRMFPYKENPFREKLKIEEDNFFSDDFEDMRNRR